MKVKFIKTLNFIYFYIFCILFLLFTGIGLLRDKNLGPANAGVNSLSANISIYCLDADWKYAPFTNITRGVPLTNYGGHDYWNVERSNQLSNNLNGKFLNSGVGSFYVYATIRNAVNFQSRTASVNWDSTSNTNSQSGSFGVIAEAGEARATFLYDERYFDVYYWSFSSIGKNNNNYATTLKNGMTLPIWASGINGVTVNFTMTFIPKMTSVTFYKQLGDNAPEQIGQNNYRFTKKLTSSHVPAANAINGYTFNGWYDKSGNFLTKSQNLLVYDLAATFTAKYTPNKYTVTLNKNNGAGGTDSITATYDSAMPSISLPSRFGYTFQGYYDTSAQTGGTQYYTLTGASARAWNKTSNSTLYARWSANSHNILLKAEGGLLSNGKDSKQISRTFGSEYGNDLNEVPTRQGYTFLGWYTDTGNKVVATDTFELDNDQTLYAHWKAKSYQATFDDQGGKTNFVDMSNVKSGTITNSGSVTKLVTGGLTYTYDTSTNILTVNGTQTESTVFSFAIINDLVAGDEYTVTMEYISGTPFTTNGCQVLEVYSKSISTLQQRNNRDFNFPTSGKTSITLTITDYAQENGYALACRMWRNTENRVFNNYKVKFTITQKTGEAKKVRDVKYDSVMTPVSIPTKYGYIFAGYYTQPNGQGTQYYDSTGKVVNNKIWDIANNATLYAKWTAKTNCVLTFNANGGEVSEASRNQTYNAVLGTLPIPTKSGYIFTGWYTSASGGSEVTSSTKMDAESKTIYAHWAETWAAKGNYSEVLYIDTDGYFQIASAEDLARLIFLINYTTRSDVLTFKYKLTNHIDMSKYYWEPIGTVSQPFASAFNGNGYTIYGIHTISQEDRKDNGGDNSGLFGVTKNAIITNLYVKDAKINGKNSVGGIIGSATNSTIKSVAIEGQINGQANIGGIAGTSSGTTINDCLIIIEGTTSSTNNGLYTGTATLNNTLYRINGIQGKSSGTFENWVYVDNMEYPLPSGLSWLASGGEIDDRILKLWSATNLIPNGDMEGTGWNGDNMSYSKEYAYSGEYSIKVTGRNYRETLTYTSTGIYLDTSHKYYFSVYTYQETRTATTIQCYWPEAEPALMTAQIKEAGEWQMYSVVAERTDSRLSKFDKTNTALRLDFDNKYVQDVIYFDNAILIDLTEVFGAGNEPSQAWLDQHIGFINV